MADDPREPFTSGLTPIEDCPNIANHTPHPPRRSQALLEWAVEMAETHHDVACDGCGHYEIWVPNQ